MTNSYSMAEILVLTNLLFQFLFRQSYSKLLNARPSQKKLIGQVPQTNFTGMCKRTLRDGTTKRTFRGCYSVTPVAWFRNQNPSFSTWFTFVTMLLGISSLKPLRRPPFSKQTNIRKKSFSFEIFSPSHEPPKMCHRKHF